MSFPRYPEYKDSGVEWLGEVPAHWDVAALKQFADKITDGAHISPETENGVYPFVSTRDVADECIDLENCLRTSQSTYDYMVKTGCRPEVGDVLFSKDGTIGRTVVVKDDREFVVASSLIIIRPNKARLEPVFLNRLCQSVFIANQVESVVKGAGLPRLSIQNLRKVLGCFPPIREQIAIAAFLDHETAKIDALVAEQQRLIELLKEKRQAVISHAVTKGLNPDAPMKHSGVEWLGEVPAHWRVVPLGKVTVSRCDGPFGSGLKSEHYTDGGVRVIRLQNIRRDGFLGTDEAYIDADYYERELSGHDVVAGDVIIAGLGDDNNLVGRACVAPRGIEPAMVKADCFRFRLDRTQATPEFVATALSAGAAADAGVLSSGSTRSRIPLSVMATRKLALPSVAEQEEIVAYVSAAALKFDTLITEAQRAIELLQERRAALISAAVSGQIDVRAIADRAAA